MEAEISIPTNVPIFDKTVWMGKDYPVSDVPAELTAFREASLKIPLTIRERFLPHHDSSVESLLGRPLPSSLASLITVRAMSCYRKEKSAIDVQCLETRKIPSFEFVQDAEACLGQALLNGSQSIVDPTYKGEPLPLWSVQFWREMHSVLEARKQWAKCAGWLEKHSEQDAPLELDESHRYLKELGWKSGTLVPGAGTYTTTLDFVRLLSDRMLTDTLVDMMVEHLAGWIRTDERLSDKFEVVTLSFMLYINKAKSAEDYKKASPNYLRTLEQKLAGKKKVLLFPVHLPERVHFDSFEIDFKQRTICYGERSDLSHKAFAY